MEHFHSWGAEQQLRAARTIPPEYGIGGLTAYGTLLGPHTHDWLQRDLVKAAQTRSLPLTIVTTESGGEVGRYEARLMLVRPDQFVAWTSGEAEVTSADAQAVIELVAG